MRLAAAIQEYTDYKRSLGMVFRSDATILKAFLQELGDMGLNLISAPRVRSFLDGMHGPVTSYWFRKFSTLNRFFRYAVSRHYMDDQPLLPRSLPSAPARLTPYLFSVEEVRRLLRVPDSSYPPRSSIEPHSVRTLILLLYGTGVRISEALRLTLSTVNLEEGLVEIRKTKFFKARLLPVGSDLKRILQDYYERQWSGRRHSLNSPFLCSRTYAPISIYAADYVFESLRSTAGVLRFDGGRYQPRLHDFRHTFAVTRLVTWYREGQNLQRLLPHLCTYLGHGHIDSTAHYLTLTKELLKEASRCFERYALGEVQHG